MDIGKTYKTPSKQAQRFFDGMEDDKASFSFPCGACGRMAQLNLRDFLHESDRWYPTLPESDVSKIQQLIQFPKSPMGFAQSHEGGRPYLAIVSCKSCSHNHLVYIGYYEFQPARYVGTLQGVYEVIL